MKYKSQKLIKYDNIIIPVHIYKEMRLDVRIAILKDKAIMRIPLFYNKTQLVKNFKWAENWIIKELDKHAKTKNRFIVQEYKTGNELSINNITFKLEVKRSTNKNYSVRLDNQIIKIFTPYNGDDLFNEQKAIKTLQSRVIAKYFHKEITNRINAINIEHFGVTINSIRLKYNKTNWGSRSSSNNINISTRLLFAPKSVQDYVFIHELAHFKEMNHSKKFWKIVQNIMPEYRTKENWLKENGSNCDF